MELYNIFLITKQICPNASLAITLYKLYCKTDQIKILYSSRKMSKLILLNFLWINLLGIIFIHKQCCWKINRIRKSEILLGVIWKNYGSKLKQYVETIKRRLRKLCKILQLLFCVLIYIMYLFDIFIYMKVI
jgi:hypothetical protein